MYFSIVSVKHTMTLLHSCLRRDNGKKKGPRTRPSGTLYFRLLTHKKNCLQIASRTSDALSLLCQPFPTWIVIFQIPSADNNNNANIYTG